ncbi:hypothetical protein HA38_13900 [Pantoea allii]|nr:hypothetical protein HA38_13900 [Pantoea allii]PBJ98772.1 hypothetical protein CMR03_18935 [Pantoea allii]
MPVFDNIHYNRRQVCGKTLHTQWPPGCLFIIRHADRLGDRNGFTLTGMIKAASDVAVVFIPSLLCLDSISP